MHAEPAAATAATTAGPETLRAAVVVGALGVVSRTCRVRSGCSTPGRPRA